MTVRPKSCLIFPGTVYIFYMLAHPDDTIIAPLTGSTPAAIALIRLSGREAIPLVAACFRGKAELDRAASHTLHYGRLVAQEDGREVTLDDVLVAVFRAPHSYTGEDSVEISCHGNPLIIRRILTLLTAAGARPAEAGEFTRRAFVNGRMDLAQAEAVADLISASDEQALVLARRQLEGRLSEEVNELRESLVRLAAHAALELDFAEEDTGLEIEESLRRSLLQVRARIAKMVASHRTAKLVHEGMQLVLAGSPNVGKSSLFNRILNEARAIVSELPGTTRDVITGDVIIEGRHWILHDTAGIRTTTADRIEALGIERTLRMAETADLILWCDDAAPAADQARTVHQLLSHLEERIAVIYLWTKADRSPLKRPQDLPQKYTTGLATQYGTREHPLRVSALTGEGLDDLFALLGQTADRLAPLEGVSSMIASVRQHEALVRAATELDAALAALEKGALELTVRSIEHGMQALAAVTGEVTTDEVLDAVFAGFCIGK